MEVFLLMIRLALATVFGVAGLAKLFDPAGSEKAFNDFGVPGPLVRLMVYLLPAAELLIAGLLLFVQTSWYGAVGAAALFAAFTAGMLYQMAKGNTPDCHCFGQIHSEPIGVSSVLRNIALLILAAILVSQGRAGQGVFLVNSNQDVMQFVIGLAVVALLGIAIFFLKQISDQQTQIMRRIELMELVARDGGTVERDDVTHPHEGLPVGAEFPDFELPDVDGGAVTLADLKADGLPVLFLFISPTCNPCQGLVPDFDQWSKDLAGRVRLVFVSGGSAVDNLTKFGGDADHQILLQKDRELAEMVKAKWTPTALLMDRKGRVASHVTAGDTAIRAFVEQIKSGDLAAEFTYFTSGNGNGHGHPHGTKIGESVPQFSATDIKGNEITSDFFKNKKTLVTFWSTTCPFCLSMMEELREWDRTKGEDDPALIVFSDGDVSEHEKFDLKSPIIIDPGHKTSSAFGMYGTPSAVLVNEQGKIVSETAIGAPDIWSLVGKRK
ncbi:MAG: MauE/DoxX family redox-associated membrane protein [Pyrinomonadaceae bacterium]